MGLKEVIKGIFSKNERYKEMEQEVRLQKMLEDRQKSANEREVEKFLKQRREEAFKNQVHEIHEMEKKKFWGNNQGFTDSHNIFHGHKSVLTNDDMFFGRGNLI